MRCPKCHAGNALLRTVGTKAEGITFNKRYIECTVCETSWQALDVILKDTIVERSKHLDNGPLFESLIPQNKLPEELPEGNEEN